MRGTDLIQHILDREDDRIDLPLVVPRWLFSHLCSTQKTDQPVLFGRRCFRDERMSTLEDLKPTTRKGAA